MLHELTIRAAMVGVCALVIVAVVRAYPSLASVEKLALWWWASICTLIALSMAVEPPYLLIGFAGLLMFGLGAFIALNVGGVAVRLARRQLMPRTAFRCRLNGAVLALIGAVWTLAFASV